MILFRADGNPTIGAGHIMRCFSLADALREEGREAVFVTAGGELEEVVRRRGYGCTVLHTAYDRMEEELPVLLPLLEGLRPDCVVLDSYFVTPRYMQALADAFPLVYLDDLNRFDYPADLVVNYNLYAHSTPYPQNKRYLLGAQYVPLRREFRNLKERVVSERVQNVLISAGGSDPEHAARAFVEYLRDCAVPDGVSYHVVLGALNQDAQEITQMAAGIDHIVLHRQVAEMRELMLLCDAAISAAGLVLYELCACGTPTVTYVLADNQIERAAAFEAVGLMLHGGDIRSSPHFAQEVFSKLNALLEDAAGRARMSRRMQALVDGNGTKRVAQEMIRLAERGGT